MRMDACGGRGRRKTGGRVPTVPEAAGIWSFMGMALLAACVHDTARLGLSTEGGGGAADGSGFDENTAWSVLAGAYAVIAGAAVAVAGGGLDGGGSDIQPPPVTAPDQPDQPDQTDPSRDPDGQPGDVIPLKEEEEEEPDEPSEEPETPNTAPSLSPIARSTYDDAARANQDFDEISGRFRITDPDRDDTHTFTVVGGVTGMESASADTRQLNMSHRVAGEYGVLYFNNTSGAWLFLPDSPKIEALTSSPADTGVMDTFTVSANDGTTNSPISRDLVVVYNGADEPNNRSGRVVLDNMMPEVGNTVTATVSDDDGVPATAIFEFFQTDDALGTNIEPIETGVTKVTDTTATLVVAEAQLGKFIGVTVRYTDNIGYDEHPEAHATAATVAAGSHNNPAQITLDPDVAVIQHDQTSFTMTALLRDADGLPEPEAITYTFFYDANGQGRGKTTIATGQENSFTVTRDTDGTWDIDGKLLGVDIAYTDRAGYTEVPSAYLLSPVLVLEAPPLPPPPPNDPPTIGARWNARSELYVNISHSERNITDIRGLTYGDRDESAENNDPNTSLTLLWRPVTSEAGLPTWDSPELTGNTHSDTDGARARYYGNPGIGDSQRKYGSWWTGNDPDSTRLEGQNPALDETGEFFWNFKPGESAAQRAALNSIRPNEVVYEAMFLQVVDDSGARSRVERILVQIHGDGARHTEPSLDAGSHNEAPTLGVWNNRLPQRERQYNEDERGLSSHQEIVFGDRDPEDPNSTLTIAYWHTFSSVGEAEELPPMGAGGGLPTDKQFHEVPNWQLLYGHYGIWRFDRYDDHPSRSHQDEAGTLLYTYDIGRTSIMKRRLNGLDTGETVTERVYLQISDRQGNKSSIESLLVTIEGRDESPPPSPEGAWTEEYIDARFDVRVEYEDGFSATGLDVA